MVLTRHTINGKIYQSVKFRLGGILDMSKKILLKKTCSIYASDLHLATIIIPFISKEVSENAIVKTMLQNDIGTDIEKVISHACLNIKTEEKIKQIDWNKTNIEKIKQGLDEIEAELQNKTNVNIIVSGNNWFIDKVNQLIDVWVKVNLDYIEKNQKVVNVINCYHFEQNEQIDEIMKKHEYILKTTGLEDVFGKTLLKRAN